MGASVKGIIAEFSRDTEDGIEIEFKYVQPLIDVLKHYITEKTTEGCLHILKFCFDNAGKDVDTVKELEDWISKNVQ